MADNKPGILDEFAEFLKAREEAAKNAQAESDDEVEVWDEKGRGARVKRSLAKPFLNSLGIDVDPEPEGDDKGDKGDGGNTPTSSSNRRSTGKTSTQASSGNVARRYFTSGKAKP